MSDELRSNIGATSPISRSRPVIYNLRPVLVGGFAVLAMVNEFWPDFGGLWVHGVLFVGFVVSGVSLLVDHLNEKRNGISSTGGR